MKKLIISMFLVFGFVQYSFAKELVAISTYISSTIVNQIGGNHVETIFIVPENANPHLFNPTFQDMATLNKASLFCWCGLWF